MRKPIVIIYSKGESGNTFHILAQCQRELPQSDRLQALNKMAISQMKTLEKSNSWLLLEEKSKN